MGSGKEAQKREDMMERAQTKKITKTAKVQKVLYWNIAGLRKKEEEFWDYVREFEIVVGLVETWVEDRSWEKNRKVVT
jgi:hypothetical protein